jgi:hypothetical protein
MAPPELVVFVQTAFGNEEGDVMLVVGVLAAAAALVLGLRFSVVTLVLLTLATVINFATSVLGGSGPHVVGLQMLATLVSVQISYLVGCLLAAHLPVRAELLSYRKQMRCVAFRQHISGKIESCSSGHCAIVFDPKDQVVGR